jgi:hypothetical protein
MIKNIDKLSPNDALMVLKKLWDNYPKLKKDILMEAEKILSDIDRNEIAENVFMVLDNIDVHELWDRSGPSANGYSSPDEMAVEMIEEELEPFNNEVNKYHNLKMAIPDYQTVMLPLLEHLGDKEEKATRETLDALASRFNLTEEEQRKEYL